MISCVRCDCCAVPTGKVVPLVSATTEDVKAYVHNIIQQVDAVNRQRRELDQVRWSDSFRCRTFDARDNDGDYDIRVGRRR